MYLDYAKIKSGQIKQPILRLRTLAGKELGPIPWVYNLSFTVNYAELSTITFTVPYQTNGMINPLYASISSFKVVYTNEFGIYILKNPKKEGDGISEVKTVTGYSLEYLFRNKDLFLEAGTYNFWNPVEPTDTILGRILELDKTWHIGYVAPRLIGCYRTFDEYDSNALDFCYGDAMKKYRCAIVFDVYEKSINVYDANENTGALPIYLDYNNLVDSVEVEEIVNEMATKLRLYGSDGLSIRDVNPIGTDYIVDLGYFLNNGDLNIKVGESDITLADRVRSWQAEIIEQQQYYVGLVSARSSLTAQKLMAEAGLVDLNGEMKSLIAQQSVTIQALSLETTSAGKQTQQNNLDSINAKIAEKGREIDSQNAKISELQKEIDEYANSIKSIVNELSISAYFTEAEQSILSQFFIDQSVNDETFVATDVDTSSSGTVSKISGKISISESNIMRIDLNQFDKTLYTIAGGVLEIADPKIQVEVVRGTLDIKDENTFVLTGYLGSTSFNGHRFESGLITIKGTPSQFTADVSAVAEHEVVEYKGTNLEFDTSNADSYFTVNVSDYQKYSVAMELYDFGLDVLSDCAYPTYEFNIDSANFLFHEKFEPFKNKLELGKSIYLALGSDGVIHPKIIGVEIDFEDITNFKLIFSNHYRLKNYVEEWIDEVRNTSRASRSLNANRYIYNRAADKVGQVSEFMSGSLNAATNTILGAANQSVVINGAGIHIGGDSKYQIRIVDSMIALSDDGWQTSKLAIGHFADPEIGDYFGVNADIIGGKLVIGNNLIIENPTNNGVMQFKVDSTGAWLNNSTFVLQKDGGGKILLDPKYGIVAGTKDLFDTDGTTVLPSFIDEDGELVLDKLGMPEKANFFLDLRDGSAYYRGDGVYGKNLYAENFYFQDGSGDVKTLIDQAAKKADFSHLDYIDLGGITLDGRTGNINFSGAGSITWGNNIPNKKRFAASTSGPWHDSMQSGDIYCCDWNYATGEWGLPYKFVGTDGRPGSDANVTYNNIKAALQKASGVSSAYLTMDEIGAPEIYGGKIYGGQIAGSSILGGAFYNDSRKARLELGDPLSGGSWGGLTLYGGHDGDRKLFEVYDSDMDSVSLSGGGAHFMTVKNEYSDGASVEAEGTWDFSNAKVTGVTAVFA